MRRRWRHEGPPVLLTQLKPARRSRNEAIDDAHEPCFAVSRDVRKLVLRTQQCCKDYSRPYRKSYGVIAITRSGLPEPFTILRGAAITIAPVGGSRFKVHQTCYAEFTCTMHKRVAWERGIETSCLSRIGADGFHSYTQYIAFFCQEC